MGGQFSWYPLAGAWLSLFLNVVVAMCGELTDTRITGTSRTTPIANCHLGSQKVLDPRSSLFVVSCRSCSTDNWTTFTPKLRPAFPRKNGIITTRWWRSIGYIKPLGSTQKENANICLSAVTNFIDGRWVTFNLFLPTLDIKNVTDEHHYF